MIKFTKMQGLGNDFVVIDSVTNDTPLSANLIRKIADRHFGIGCDQVLVVEPPPKESNGVDFGYRIFNADGTQAKQCGNGVRCVAKFVVDMGLSAKSDLVFATKSCRMHTHLDDSGQVTVDIGSPVFDPVCIPFVVDKKRLRYNILLADYGEVELGAVSVGNPHAVILVDDVATFPVAKLGGILAKSDFFPEGVNVNFMQVLGSGHIKLRVYERGSGETLACGSGACASVVIGRLWGLLDTSVVVELAGGNLLIKWNEADNNIWMTGPAESVFKGELLLLE